MVKREVLFLRIRNVHLFMYAALYNRKWRFFWNVNFGLVVLAFHYDISVKASKSPYTL